MKRNIENAENILKLVQEMRTNQKTFFTSKSNEIKNQALTNSKKMEKVVDQQLIDYFSPQESLF